MRSLLCRSPLPTLADDYDKLGFHYERGNAMLKKILVAAVLGACSVFGGQQVRGDDYIGGYPRSNVTNVTPYSRGASYQTYIPRPTQKGYYTPKVVPYPAGKPVFVQGYYRKSGTYVPPHFRSLPRR